MSIEPRPLPPDSMISYQSNRDRVCVCVCVRARTAKLTWLHLKPLLPHRFRAPSEYMNIITIASRKYCDDIIVSECL